MNTVIREQAAAAVTELCDKAHLKSGQLLVVGCSSSEVDGKRIGSSSDPETAQAIYEGIIGVLQNRGIYLAAQCCEHLNRALVLEREAASGYEIVSVVPQPKAGGSFATAAYHGFKNPVIVETVQADAGLDIGLTLIGMHLKRVAVPVRLENSHIGCALLSAAKTRPKFIGGCRAVYDV